MKRILTVLVLVTALCFCLVSCGDLEIDGLTGNTDITCKVEDGEATVTKVPNKSIVTHIVIPDEYEGTPVTEIGEFAATNLEYVTKITIGKNVEEISPWAFGNSRKITEFEVDENNPYICDVDGVIYSKDMKTILFYPPARDTVTEKDKDGNEVLSISYTVPEGVETVRSKAFYKCYELREITLPSTLVSIEEKAFFRCSLKEINLPEKLQTIGKDAFSFCSEVEEITIPASVVRIDEYAFFNCTALTKINMKCKESEVALAEKWCHLDNGVKIEDKINISWVG